MIISNHVLQLLKEIAVLFPVFLLVFTFRGFMQACVANLMGDSTAKEEGFLTLNPLAHVELFGLTAMMAIFFFFGSLLRDTIPGSMLLILLIILGVRWTHPVPIEESNFKNYRLGGIMTALSGLFGDIIIAFISVLTIRILLIAQIPRYALVSLLEILRTIIDISLFIGVLNLIPLPPFDGGKLLHYVLPQSQQYIVNWLEKYAFFIFVGVLLVPGISDFFLGGVSTITAIIKKALFTMNGLAP